MGFGWTVALVFATALDAGPAASAPSNEMLASLLLKPEERDRATCELPRRQHDVDTNPAYSHCHVNSVMTAPQPNEPPIFAVFLAEEGSADRARVGHSKGPFRPLRLRRPLLPVFWNANVLDESGDLIRWAGDDRLAKQPADAPYRSHRAKFPIRC